MLTAISATMELNRRKSAEKQRRLAGQINNGSMLIAVMRFLIKELGDHEAKNARDIDERAKRLIKGSKLYWRPYRRAARIALGIRFNGATQSYRLPNNYRRRLIDAGVRPGNQEKFEQLNSQLIIDEELLAFAKENPVLDRVKRLLNKDFPIGGHQLAENTFGGTSLTVGSSQMANPFQPPDMEMDAQEEREAQKRSWFYQHGIELD
jgi:hypothetical protein